MSIILKRDWWYRWRSIFISLPYYIVSKSHTDTKTQTQTHTHKHTNTYRHKHRHTHTRRITLTHTQTQKYTTYPHIHTRTHTCIHNAIHNTPTHTRACEDIRIWSDGRLSQDRPYRTKLSIIIVKGTLDISRKVPITFFAWFFWGSRRWVSRSTYL